MNWGCTLLESSKIIINTVIQYIKSQEIHHQKRTFREEYLELLQKNEIEFNDEYVFIFFDDVSNWE